MVGTTLNKETYSITSASTAAMDIPFRYDDNSWINAVAYTNEGDTTSTLVLGTDFTLSGNGVESLGEITLSAGFLSAVPDEGMTLVVYRIANSLQTLDLEYNTRLPALALETAIDKLSMASIDRSNTLQRTFLLPYSDPESFESSYQIEGANERKGTVMVFRDPDGKPIRMAYSDLATEVLRYVDLGNVGEEVLAAISALSPLEVFTEPTVDLSGNFGQLAIKPESVELTITGTLTPDITGNLLPWKTENGKLWFSTSGLDPTTDGLSSSVTIGWNGGAWVIVPYIFGVPQTTRWLSLNGASSPYPNNVTVWLNISTTGNPSVDTFNPLSARLWINHAPTGVIPNWVEIFAPPANRLGALLDGDSLAYERYSTDTPGRDLGFTNPDGLVAKLRVKVGPTGTVVSNGIPSQTSTNMIDHIQDTLALLDPTLYEKSIYMVLIGTNDFTTGISNSTTIANIKTAFTAARARGFQKCGVIIPKWVSGQATSQTLAAAIIADGTGFYDLIVDFGRSLSGFLTFDNIHWSAIGATIGANRIYQEMILERPVEPWVGTEGFFSTVKDCLAYHEAYSLDCPVVEIRGTNEFYPGAEITAENSIDLYGNDVTVDVTSGSAWHTAVGVLKDADNSATSLFKVTGAGTWVFGLTATGVGYPSNFFGDPGPDVIFVNVNRFEMPNCRGAVIHSTFIRWEVPVSVITTPNNSTPFYPNQATWNFLFRNCFIRMIGGPLFSNFGTSGNNNPFIQNCTFVTDNAKALRNNTGGNSAFYYIGDNYCTDNTLTGGDVDDTTNGTINVLPAGILTKIRPNI